NSDVHKPPILGMFIRTVSVDSRLTESIFSRAQIREMLDVAGKQEGVGGPFLADGRGNGRAFIRPLPFNMTEAVGNCLVLREGMGGKARVGQRIFVRAIELGVV